MAPNDQSYLSYEKAAAAQTQETLGDVALEEARHASDREHGATFWTSIKKHKKAAMWSAIISMSIVMEG